MHNSLKIIKTLLYSYSALHVSGTLAAIIRSLLILHIRPPVTVCRVGCIFQLWSVTTVAKATVVTDHVHREETCSTGMWKAGVRLCACAHAHTHTHTHTTSVHSFPDPSIVTNRQNIHLCFSFQGRTSPASQSRPG
jgi:hypothetical protein